MCAQLIFAISVLPFIADFLLIATYPTYMNETPDKKLSAREILRDTNTAMADVLRERGTRKPLLARRPPLQPEEAS